MNVYIQEVVDPETRKRYNVHIQSCDEAPFPGFTAYDIYLTDYSPDHDVLVGIGKKSFAKDKAQSQEDMMEELNEIIQKNLPNGIKLFESIVENCIKDNEL